MKSIWKYELSVTRGEQRILMPKGSKVLCLNLQNQTPTLWAEVDTDGVRISRTFEMRGTGWDWHEVEPSEYVGTVQIGEFVWHYYEIDSPEKAQRDDDLARAVARALQRNSYGARSLRA